MPLPWLAHNMGFCHWRHVIGCHGGRRAREAGDPLEHTLMNRLLFFHSTVIVIIVLRSLYAL